MTLAEFYDACEHHDWHHAMSDDGAVHRRGQEAEAKLVRESYTSPEKRAIYDERYDYVHSGPAYGSEKAPAPVRPEE